MYEKWETGKNVRRSPGEAKAGQKRRSSKVAALVLPALLVMAMAGKAPAQVLFSDTFDNSADWQSKQTVAKSAGGVDRAWPATYAKACSSTCPPEGWTAYRTSASHFTDTPAGDTYILSAMGARGSNGKGITLNVESTSGYGDWAGGSLDTYLGSGGYKELYVRYWLKYDADWVWTDPSNTQHAQQKLMRISRFTGDLNNYASNNPQMYFTPTQNGPSWMPDWYYNKSYSTTSFFSSEFFNVQPSGSIGYGPTQTFSSLKWPSDGKWHSYEFRVKMNSAPGVADGEWEIWIDGQNTADKHAVKKNVLWVDSTGSVTQGWNYVMFLDNITLAPAPVSAKKEMQILMDDVVVATHYSGPPPQPAALTASALGDKAVRLKWTAGANGASYAVTGYRIYYGSDPANLNSVIDAGNVLQYDVASLDPSTKYYFAVSGYNKAAYDSNDNESIRSATATASTGTAPVSTAPADTTAPVASISSPAQGSSVKGTVTVSVAASDNVGVSKVEFYLNGSIFGLSGAAPYSITWNTANNADGAYTLLAKAYDAAGNVGQSSVSVNVANGASVPAPPATSSDATAPLVYLTAPTFGSQLSGTALVSANASDNVAVAKVEFFVNGVLKGTSTSAPYSYSWNTATVANGSYSVTAKAYDAAGNAKLSEAKPVTVSNVDRIAPTVSISSPTSGAKVAGNVLVSASASDNLAVAKVEFFVNGALKGTSTSAPYSYNWNTLAEADGSCSVTAKAYDAAGNATLSEAKTVTVANRDSVAPSVYLTSPTFGAKLAGTVSVSANAGDNVAVTKVEFFVNGVLKGTSTSAPYSYSWNTATVPNGSYSVTAKAYDAAGNATISEAKPVTVANLDSIAPTVYLTSPTFGAKLAGTVSVSANASDNVAVTKVEFFVNGVLKGTSTSAPYNYSWNTATVANGSYSVTAKAYDAAGNATISEAKPVTVSNADTAAPVIKVTAPTATTVTVSSVTISASATDNVGVTKMELYLNGSLKLSTNAASFSTKQRLLYGSNAITVKAYDAAGNVATQSWSIVRK